MKLSKIVLSCVFAGAAVLSAVAFAVSNVTKIPAAVAPLPAPAPAHATQAAVPTAMPQATGAFTSAQVDQVKEIIHDYLVTNPQVLVEASQALQKQEISKAEQKAQGAIVANAATLFADANSPVAGNPKGDVTVIEFFDYQCPHCKEMGPVLDKIRAGDAKVRVVYKELPIFGTTSREASFAALAAYQQGMDKYLKFHDALLAASNPLDKDKVLAIAKTSGLDVEKLKIAMNSEAVKKQVEDNFRLAQVLGLMGTPTFIISPWQVGGAHNSVDKAAFIPGIVSEDDLKQAVSDARKS